MMVLKIFKKDLATTTILKKIFYNFTNIFFLKDIKYKTIKFYWVVNLQIYIGFES